ncbi:hypothetical protein QUF72_18390 [Desulfobacterales bacterium HSG2]|nr:hypothetical protein [Desulfobacterales bacterium HSG2]
MEKKEIILQEEADRIIRQHVYVSMGFGLIPIPFVDAAGLAVICFNLSRKLAQLYNVHYTGKKAIMGVLLSFTDDAAIFFARKTIFPKIVVLMTASLSKFIPGAGQAVGMSAMPVISGATTYAVGKVINLHFASGGTFLSFNPDKAKAYYEKMFAEGKQVAADMEKRKAQSAG